MSDARVWLAGLVALPALVIGASCLRVDLERLRRLAVASAIAMVLAALVIALSPSLRVFSIRTSALTWIPGGERLIRVDTLSGALLPFAAGLWLLTVAVTPARRSIGAACGEPPRHAADAGVVSHRKRGHPPAVVGGLRVDVPVSARRSGTPASTPRGVRHLGDSTLLFAVGVALLVSPGGQSTRIETAAMWLIVVAALVRKGIVPFHAWVPEVFDHGRLGPAILFNAPQVGAYMTVVLIVPRASPETLRRSPSWRSGRPCTVQPLRWCSAVHVEPAGTCS